jgi:hypothetical protein
MEIIRSAITRQGIVTRFLTHHETFTKAVVDVSRRLMAVDAEWHADLEIMLLEDGARQEDLWGINLWPHRNPTDFVAYESLINIRPRDKNFSIEISDEVLRQRIRDVVDDLVDWGAELLGVEEQGAPYPTVRADAAEGTWGETQPASYPCLKHHKQLTMEKWRSFEAYKRVLMIANEFGRAKSFFNGTNWYGFFDCYERALELFHITMEAGRIEGISPDIIAGLLRLRERTAWLLVERRIDPDENQRIREALIRLDPDGYRLFVPENADGDSHGGW